MGYDDTLPGSGHKILSRLMMKKTLRENRTKVQKCQWCAGIGKPYKAKLHPAREDCHGTGRATDNR